MIRAGTMPRVAKVPGSKWRLVTWYLAHLPARKVYLEPYFGSGAVLFNKPRSPTEIVSDVDGRVVALFKCLRDRPRELARVVKLTPWARGEWQACRAVPDAEDELELARQFLVSSWQSHGLRSLSRSGWRHDGPSGRIGKSVAKEWAALPEKIMRVCDRLAGVHIENRPALDMLRRYRGPQVTIFDDPPYPRKSVHGERDALYRHEMLDEDEHREHLTEALLHPGPFLACSYRNDLYDSMLLGAGWSVAEAITVAEHGQTRVEALYMNRLAAAARPREQLGLLNMGAAC